MAICFIIQSLYNHINEINLCLCYLLLLFFFKIEIAIIKKKSHII